MVKSRKLSYAYAETAALTDVDLHIAKGSFVAILGHNGSGKSTLAKHLNALLTPTGGTLWVNGMDTADPENIWAIRQLAGMVFQNPDNQIIAAVVEEDVAFGPENLGVAPVEIRSRVDGTLAAVGMSGYKQHAPHQLSGGQKQRVAVAGVLAMQPDCIVLDEPTAMLDPEGRREVMDTVCRLNRTGITVILITHFMEEAALANRVLVMRDGTVVMDAPPREVFRQAALIRSLGLDVPPVTALAHQLRAMGVPVQDDILTVAEFMADPVIRRLGANGDVNHGCS